MDFENPRPVFPETADTKPLPAMTNPQGRNPRGAGRKKKFTAEDLASLKAQMEQGASIQTLANKYHTSRQIISKYVNRPITEEFPLRITYMYRQTAATIIYVNFEKQRIIIQNRTDDMLHRAFGVNETPDWADFCTFLADRCFPASRSNAKTLLNKLQLDGYDPLQIVEKTGGRMAEDDLWLRFAYWKE